MHDERQAVSKLYEELHGLFIKTFGKEPHPEVIQAEVENLVLTYGPIEKIKDIFTI
jgi:hypothetical protein